MTPVYADIPYLLKDRAKALGARWDANARQWWMDADRCSSEELAAFEAMADDAGLPAYDRPTRMIFPELVPSSAWYSNLRNAVTQPCWNAIKDEVRARQGGRCAITGMTGRGRALDLHEHWDFDEHTATQRLTGFSLLAPEIHECMHPGFAEMNNRLHLVVANMVRFNQQLESGYDKDYAMEDLKKAFVVWRHLSRVPKWTLDLSLMQEYDTELVFVHARKEKC